MGLMTELFLADRGDEAMRYDPTAGSADRLQLSGLTDLEFGTLWAILCDEPWSPEKHSLVEVVAGEEEWTFEFPADYVTRLGSATDAERASAAARWSATEEIESTPDVVLPIVEQVASLARSAVSKRQKLFLWVSL